MNFTLIFQIFSFLVAHKDDIKDLILGIEAMIPDAPGASKAASVKEFIGNALGVGDKIEAAWPVVLPVFNLLVATVKGAAAK